MNKRYSMLAKDTVLFGISSFASKFLIFVLLPLYTNVLSPIEYGEVDIMMNIVNLIYPLLTLSIVEGVLRFAFMSEVRNSEVLSIGLFFEGMGGMILVILAPLSSVFGKTMDKYWWYFITLFLGYSLQNLFACYCRGTGRIKLFALQGIIQTISMVALNFLFLLLFNMGISGYLFAIIGSYFIAITVMVVFGKIYLDIMDIKLNKTLLHQMLAYSIPLIPSMIAWWINNSADKYTIIALVGIGASGIYSVSHKIPTILITFADIFNQAFLISAVDVYKKKDSNVFYRSISTGFLILCLFVCSILITGSELIGKILFSNEYYIGWTYVPMLLIASVFSSLAAYLAIYFRTIKQTNILLYSTLIGAFGNIILNYLLIKKFGIIGVTYATAFGFLIVFMIRYFTLRGYIELNILSKKNIMMVLLVTFQAIIMGNKCAIRYYVNVFALLTMCAICRYDLYYLIKIVNAHFVKKEK